MSMNALETQIWRECQEILQNKKIRKKDMMEWSTGPIDPRDDEVVVRVEHLGINAAFKKELDKRPAQEA